MFPFFAPLQSQQQTPNSFPNQQFRPNTQNAILSQNPQLQQPNQAGFNPQNANLMMPGRPPSMPMLWPCQMNGGNVQIPIQFGLQQPQQQRFPNFNQVVGAPVPQGFNTVNCNPQVLCPQSAGQGVNQMVGLPQGQLHAQNAALPVNNAIVQQCLQNFLGANQLAAFNNLVANQFAANQITAAAPSGVNGTLSSGDAGNSKNVNPQQAGQPVTNCWNAIPTRPEIPVASQSSWPFVVPNIQQILQAQNNLLSGGLQGMQESQAETSGNDNTRGNSAGPKSIANPNRSWNSGQSSGRPQNLRSHNTRNENVNFGVTTGNRDKGWSYFSVLFLDSYATQSLEVQDVLFEVEYAVAQLLGANIDVDVRENRHPQHAKFSKDHRTFNKDHQTMPKRSLSATYTNQEILQWRESRKRNYPTKSKIEKSFSQSDKDNGDIDPEAAIRRQQLKEILAKQAELGVEVAELPPNYLSETENKTFARNDHINPRERRGRFQNKFKKRGRRGQDNRYPKRQRTERPANSLALVKRSPSLFQKLLNPEIKQDRSYLLQVFRFMTLNSFFDDWPEKHLVFPRVSAKDACYGASEDFLSVGPDGASVGVNLVVGGLGEDDKVEEGEVGNRGSWESDDESDSEKEEENDNRQHSEMLEGEI